MPTQMTDLSGVTVVVTRPEHQATVLCQSIEAQGGVALRVPVIEIRPSADAEGLKAQLSHLNDFQLAIFVSANAVVSTLQMLGSKFDWPASLEIAAVGQATAKVITSNNLKVTHVSPEPFNSEALLNIPELQSIDGQRVIIFRGNGGRELLGDTLQQRGAKVEYAECYQRAVPMTNMATLYELWGKGGSMPIVVTSNEGLNNLYSMVDQSQRRSLLKSPLIVVSQRAASLAEELGFTQKVLVSENASNDAILSTVKQWKES